MKVVTLHTARVQFLYKVVILSIVTRKIKVFLGLFRDTLDAFQNKVIAFLDRSIFSDLSRRPDDSPGCLPK